MLVLQVTLGNVARGVCLDPRLHYKCTFPRLPVELPVFETIFRIDFYSNSYRQQSRIMESQKLGGYCWPTSKCRNWCAQHTFFEGKKVEATSPRQSTPRTL